MKVLICGADGFIGGSLCAALSEAGHEVVRGVRRPRQAGDVAIDYRHDRDPAVWRPRLQGMDAVVNAVGILHEARPGDFDAIHAAAPAALFAACSAAGVARVIQLSALGAQADADTPYLRSKAAADAALLALPLCATVLRPTLVFGRAGASARFFMHLARLPIAPLPGDGEQRVQPVHIDDLAAAVCRLLELAAPPPVLDAPGGRAVSFREMLAIYRRGQGLPPAPVVGVPMALMHVAARGARHLPGSLLSADTLAMLVRGNTGDPAALAALLGRSPRAIDDFVPPQPPPTRLAALDAGLLHGVLALLWLGSALASVSLVGETDGFALLALAAVPAVAAPWLLYGGAAVDAVLGALSVLRPGRALWRWQFGLVLFYTAFISVQMPALWAHPFGPVLKNLPILALLFVLWRAEGSATTESLS